MSKDTGSLRCAVCHRSKPLNDEGYCTQHAGQLVLPLPAVRGANGKFVRLAGGQ